MPKLHQPPGAASAKRALVRTTQRYAAVWEVLPRHRRRIAIAPNQKHYVLDGNGAPTFAEFSRSLSTGGVIAAYLADMDGHTPEQDGRNPCAFSDVFTPRMPAATPRAFPFGDRPPRGTPHA